MHTKELIDAIVRQTVVLIAQVATNGGIRAPLASIANQVFIGLVRELEDQGVRRKVVADMFGLALRSYQQKVQRITESATDRNITLWEAVYRFATERESFERKEIIKRFRRDDEASLRGVLSDLVQNGLLVQQRTRDKVSYHVTPKKDLASDQSSDAALSELLWMTIYRNPGIRLSELTAQFSNHGSKIQALIQSLEREDRIEGNGTDDPSYRSAECLLPLGSAVGWEAAIFDHFQAMAQAIAAKLSDGKARAKPDDRIGGSTFSFDIWPGHPLEKEIHQVLSFVRTHLSQLRDQVVVYNTKHGYPERYQKATFYCGQSLIDCEAADPVAEEAAEKSRIAP